MGMATFLHARLHSGIMRRATKRDMMDCVWQTEGAFWRGIFRYTHFLLPLAFRN